MKLNFWCGFNFKCYICTALCFKRLNNVQVNLRWSWVNLKVHFTQVSTSQKVQRQLVINFRYLQKSDVAKVNIFLIYRILYTSWRSKCRSEQVDFAPCFAFALLYFYIRHSRQIILLIISIQFEHSKHIGIDTKMTGLNDDKTIRSVHLLRLSSFSRICHLIFYSFENHHSSSKWCSFLFFHFSLQTFKAFYKLFISSCYAVSELKWVILYREEYTAICRFVIFWRSLSNRIRHHCLWCFTSYSPIH